MGVFRRYTEKEKWISKKVEADALYADYIRKLALKGEKKEVVLKAAERIFEELIVPKIGISGCELINGRRIYTLFEFLNFPNEGVTGFEMIAGRRNFEYSEISDVLRSRVKEEYGTSAVPYAQEYMDMLIESIANSNYKNKKKEISMIFPPTHAIRPTGQLPA